jgi:hypothetical protein
MTLTPTEHRKQAAASFAAQLGIDPAALYEGAIAAWSNLNPQSVPFEHALSVAGVVLRAARDVPRASWRKCRYCHADIVSQGPRPDWAAAEPGPHPALFCPEAPGARNPEPVDRLPAHEPMPGDGRRTFQLNSDPIKYGHGKQLMREVIQTDPDGRRSVLAVIPDQHSFDTWELLGRVYDQGREDLAAERAIDADADASHHRAVTAARELYAAEEGGQCEDYARGMAALIARLLGGDRDEIEAAIERLPEGVDNPSYFGLPEPGTWRPGQPS